MRKTGILGGSFNPIHNGHIKLGLSAYEEFNLDRVLYIPSGYSYFKSDICMPEGSVRLDMVDIAIDDYKFFESSDIEIKRPGNTYTIDTLIELRDLYPEDEFYFIAGADSLYSMGKWKSFDKLSQLTSFIISVRNGIDSSQLVKIAKQYHELFNSNIYFIKEKNFEVSSTYIRDKIYETDLSSYLNKNVIDYIKKHELYI